MKERIEKRVLLVPQSLEVNIKGNVLEIIPLDKKKITFQINPYLNVIWKITAKERFIILSLKPIFSRKMRHHLLAFLGTFSMIVKNFFQGLVKSFVVEVKLTGSGCRVNYEDNKIFLHINLAQPLIVIVPEIVKVKILAGNLINLSSYDKQLVGEIAGKLIRIMRPFNTFPFKGRVIYYYDKNKILKYKVAKSKLK